MKKIIIIMLVVILVFSGVSAGFAKESHLSIDEALATAQRMYPVAEIYVKNNVIQVITSDPPMLQRSSIHAPDGGSLFNHDFNA